MTLIDKVLFRDNTVIRNGTSLEVAADQKRLSYLEANNIGEAIGAFFNDETGKGGDEMKANVLCVLISISLLAMLLPGTGLAGVEPSPFQPQINQLHSIELNVGALDKRMAKLAESNADVYGQADQLQAIANKLADLDARVEDTLDQLPPLTTYFDGSDDVLFAMEGIKSDSDSILHFAERMGIEPSPFIPYFDALQAIQFNADTIKLRSIGYICPVGTNCIPQ